MKEFVREGPESKNEKGTGRSGSGKRTDCSVSSAAERSGKEELWTGFGDVEATGTWGRCSSVAREELRWRGWARSGPGTLSGD